jgi:V/A-type H+-transporting ATPase subunit C
VRILRDIRNVKNLLRTKHLSYEPEKILEYFMGEGKEIAQWKYQELAEAQAVSQIISGLEGTSYYEPLKNNIDVYNKEHSIQYLETGLDAHCLHLIRDLSQEYYVTIGPTIRFLISKEYEIQNLKAIVKGVAENLPRDRIQQLLVTEDAS